MKNTGKKKKISGLLALQGTWCLQLDLVTKPEKARWCSQQGVNACYGQRWYMTKCPSLGTGKNPDMWAVDNSLLVFTPPP